MANLPKNVETNIAVIRAAGFDHIAHALEQLWQKPPACRDYIRGLVLDRKTGLQRGFPLHVMRSILQLHAAHPSTPNGENAAWSKIRKK